MRKQSKSPPSFPALVQAFFVEHLTQQRALSPQTVAAYRDAFMLFLGFAEARLVRSPAMITLADITPDLITAFLDHLERERHNSVRSRNAGTVARPLEPMTSVLIGRSDAPRWTTRMSVNSPMLRPRNAVSSSALVFLTCQIASRE